MNAYIKSSLIYKLLKTIYTSYKNSLLFYFGKTFGIWIRNSKTHRIFVNYFEKTQTTKYSQTYRFINFIFKKIDICVGRFHDNFLKFIKFSLIFSFFYALYQEGKRNFKSAVSIGLLFFILGYSLMTTYLGYWSITKIVFLVLCFFGAMLVYKSINVILWIKNSVSFRLIKFLEE